MSETPGRPGADATLTGREAEVDALVRAIAAAPADGSPVVLVEGAAGIGKTALVEAAAARAASTGWAVRRGRAREMEGHLAYGVVAEALLGGAGPDAELVPRGSRTTVDEGRAAPGRVLEDLLRLVDGLTTDAPLLLLLDDLQWADGGSLLFLTRLVRESAGRPCVVLLTARPTPRPVELEALVAMLDELPGARRLQLQPLSAAAAADLAERLTGAPLDVSVAVQVARAGGNPLLISELLSALAAQDALAVGEDGHVRLVGQGWEGPVSLAVADRLRFLSPAARDTATLAAVLGSRFSVAHLVALAGRPASVLWPDLRELLSTGTLQEDGECLAFRHDLVHEALYRSVPGAVRIALHAQAAQALEQDGAPAGAVAEHVLRSAVRDDPTARQRLRRAAREALASAPSMAVELLREALSRTAALSPERHDLAVDRALALSEAGRHLEARDAAGALLAGGGLSPREGELWSLLVSASLAAGDFGGLETADAALASGSLSQEQAALVSAYRPLLVRDDPGPEAMAAWARLGRTFYVDPVGAERRARQAAELARRTGAVAAESAALLIHGLALQGRVDVEANVATGLRAVALAEVSGTREAFRGFPHCTAASAFEQADLLEETQAVLLRGRRAAEQLGDANHLQLLHGAAAMIDARCGRWDDALAEVEAGLTLAESIGARPWIEAWTIRGQIAVHRGDLALAATRLEQAEQLVAAGLPVIDVGRVGALRAMLTERTAGAAAALGVLSELWDDLGTVGVRGGQFRLAPDLARLARTAGDAARAEEAARLAESVVASNPGPVTLRAAAVRTRGLAHDDPDVLLEALALLDAVPRPLERASCAAEAASALVRQDRRDEARACADQALAGFAQLQAEGELLRTRSALRDAGLVLGVRGPRVRPRSGWAALTDTEVKVAHLVAERLSNPEIADRLFVSRRTVQTHVSHILAKLGVPSRGDLVSAHARGELEALG